MTLDDIFGEAKRKQRDRHLRRLANGPRGEWERREITDEMIQTSLGRGAVGTFALVTHGFVNNHHSVMWSVEPSEWGPVIHLWIRRHDGEPIYSWSALQRIKDELVGEDRTAVDVYPAKGDLVDQANMYHLWVLPEGFRLPFGLRSEVRR